MESLWVLRRALKFLHEVSFRSIVFGRKGWLKPRLGWTFPNLKRSLVLWASNLVLGTEMESPLKIPRDSVATMCRPVTLRILVVDDNERVRRGVAALLARRTEWEVCGQARDGDQALLMASVLRPDLVVLDISMPGLNGLDVARTLRKDLPDVVILIMSQHDPSQLLPRALSAGADGCLDKTDLSQQLILEIESAVAKRNAGKNKDVVTVR